MATGIGRDGAIEGMAVLGTICGLTSFNVGGENSSELLAVGEVAMPMSATGDWTGGVGNGSTAGNSGSACACSALGGSETGAKGSPLSETAFAGTGEALGMPSLGKA